MGGVRISGLITSIDPFNLTDQVPFPGLIRLTLLNTFNLTASRTVQLDSTSSTCLNKLNLTEQSNLRTVQLHGFVRRRTEIQEVLIHVCTDWEHVDLVLHGSA